MKRLCLFFFLLFAAVNGYSQYGTPQNYKWAFGTRAGVDFSSGSPVAMATSIGTSEGCASVSDASGALLFYTDGYNIWNRAGSIMPSGSAIVPYSASSTTQAALIIPVLGTTTRYYVFSMESYTTAGRLMYCIVDMTLAAGMGDVVASTRATSLGTGMGERMIAVGGNSCDIWLLTHKETGLDFYAYDITASGIGSPVVSTVGTFTGSRGYSIGHLMISPDRTKLASTSYNGGSYVANGVGAELYDFNPTSGVVSNVRRLDSLQCVYGAEISPDNSKLYIIHNSGVSGPTMLDQFDITGASAATIRSTRTTINTSSAACWPSLKLARDSKIYIGSMTGASTNFLDCIASPNTAGSGCGFSSSAVTLSSGSTHVYGLPNLYFAGGSGDTGRSSHDTTLCIPITGVTLTPDTTGTSYLWSTGATTTTISPTAPGTYWVYIVNNCRVNIDTIRVHQSIPDTVFFKHDTTVCSDVGSITLTAPTGYVSYLWSDGSVLSTLSVSASGNYYVTSAVGCHIAIDSFHATFIPFAHSSSSSDTDYCFPGKIVLHAPNGYASYAWQDASTNATYDATAAGTYFVKSTAYCQDRVDSFTIRDVPLTFTLGADVEVCSNYIIDAPVKGNNVSYLWQDGYTGSSYSASHSGTYSVRITKGNCVATDDINVKFIHLQQNIPDTFLCKGTKFSIDLVATPPSGGSVLWNDGSTSPVRTVTDSGTYWVYVSLGDCQILDTVNVLTGHCDCWHDVASAFTPNGDGLNDIVKPRIQPGCDVSGYLFNIYNRWGELVFSSDVPGKGWDGTYKGEKCELGVYMYSLQFFLGVNNKSIVKSGSITLIH